MLRSVLNSVHPVCFSLLQSLLYSSQHILIDPTILIIFSASTTKTKINLYVQTLIGDSAVKVTGPCL